MHTIFTRIVPAGTIDFSVPKCVGTIYLRAGILRTWGQALLISESTVVFACCRRSITSSR